MDEIITFIDQLPNDLRMEMSFFVFEKTFKELEFFKGRPLTYIAWVCPLLKPLIKSEEQYIYYEEDDVSCIYFFLRGKAGYVLPRHKNLVFCKLTNGYHFGISCIVASFIKKEGDFTFDIDNWIQARDTIKR